jgi:hypothetical protein
MPDTIAVIVPPSNSGVDAVPANAAVQLAIPHTASNNKYAKVLIIDLENSMLSL